MSKFCDQCEVLACAPDSPALPDHLALVLTGQKAQQPYMPRDWEQAVSYRCTVCSTIWAFIAESGWATGPAAKR
jgi:hypothetical protein